MQARTKMSTRELSQERSRKLFRPGRKQKRSYYGAPKSKNGYDAGFIKDEYFCNAIKCECAQIDQAIIGKLKFFLSLSL